MTRRTGTQLVLVSIALVAALVVPGEVSAATRDVEIFDFFYAPSEITVNPGDEVVWTNQGPSDHTVTDDDHIRFDSGFIDRGLKFRHVFQTPGRFPYHCDIHGLQGVIVVAADGSTTTTSTSTSTSTPTTSTTLPPTNAVVAGAAFLSTGTSAGTGPSGSRVSVFATSAETGFSYRLVSGHGTAQQPCSTDVVPVNDTVRLANAQGLIAQTAGTVNRQPGVWQLCFLAPGQVVTGAVTYTVAG